MIFPANFAVSSAAPKSPQRLGICTSAGNIIRERLRDFVPSGMGIVQIALALLFAGDVMGLYYIILPP
jgi:hypothetical protein